MKPDCIIITTVRGKLEGLGSYKNILKINDKKGGPAAPLGPFPKSAYADESSENNPVPRAFSLAWGCSENYVNLALAGFFAIKIKCFAPSNLADTV